MRQQCGETMCFAETNVKEARPGAEPVACGAPLLG